MAKEGKSTSEIGILLRDTYGIPSVKLITGKRVNYGLNTIGGVRRDIPVKLQPEIFSKLLYLKNRAKKYKKLCNSDPLIQKRTKDIGMSLWLTQATRGSNSSRWGF